MNGRWQISVVDVGLLGTPRVAVPDRAERQTPDWIDDSTLVVVSEASGVANLERLSFASGQIRPLTRVVGAVLAPDADPVTRRVYFLSLHAKGFDVRRVSLDSTTSLTSVPLDPSRFPVAPSGSTPADSFTPRPVPPSHAYGLGPRRWMVLPGGAAAVEGSFATLMIANTDPVGRLGVVLQGGYGEPSAWRGGSLQATLRRWPIHLEGGLFATSQSPSKQRTEELVDPSIDARYTGGTLVLSYDRDLGSKRFGMRLGGSLGALDRRARKNATRSLALAEVSAGSVRGSGRRYITGAFNAHGSVGSTDGVAWRRGTTSIVVGAGAFGVALRGEALLGVLGGDAPNDSSARFEQFLLGGVRPPFFDRSLLSQRVTMPAVPIGYAGGRKVALYRVSTGRIPYLILPITPYVTWLSAGDSFDHWQRVIGAEREVEFRSMGFARLPTVRIRGGVGYSLDQPFRRKVGAYLSVVYRP
jgi:hypothetical protein